MKTLFSRPDRINEPLYVVTSIFNSPRFRTRWKHYEDFAKRISEARAILYTVEVAFGNREFAITNPSNPHHIQLRTNHELWLKENAINIAISRLPQDWKYVAWIDADIRFLRDDWDDETIHKLQHYDIVQMFSEAADLNNDYEIGARYRSFGHSFINNIPWETGNREDYYYDTYKSGPYKYLHHPGFAWACTRKAFDILGGLFDKAILGEADYLMARAIAGQDIVSLRNKYTAGYRRHLQIWQDRARLLNCNLGFVPGAIMHYFHGPKINRKYWDRTKILIRNEYNPDTDIKRDWQGLYQLSEANSSRMIRLRNELREYFQQRNEDATG